LIKKDQGFAEKTFAKWLREKEPYLIKKTVESYAKIFKSTPYVPDKGIETVMKDLTNRRPIPKEFIGHPEYFRDNSPLEKALSRS